MKSDIKYTVLKNETILHPNSVKGAEWIAKHLTTNVTDIHYSGPEGHAVVMETIGKMKEDGLTVTERQEGEAEEIDWAEFYTDGECPDCGETIPSDTPEGGECVNCGHVFYTSPNMDDDANDEASK